MVDLKYKITVAVGKDLSNIEKAIVDNLKPHFDLVSKVSGHILFSGGKRLRPLLMVLSARLCGYEKHDQFKYSTMFEYLHTATLLHDDIVDIAETRRNKAVANRLWGYPTVLLTGDFLLARSVSIAASSGMCQIIEVIADIAEKMSQGEVEQLRRKKDFSLTEDEYLKIISYKTAKMFGGACKSGALLACSGHDYKVDALANYGYNLGMAFQMIDDLLDYSINSLNTGKKIGTDLREGKLTMPTIFSMNQASEGDKRKMRLITSSGSFSESEFSWFVDALKKYGGIEYTRLKSINYIKNAKESLLVFDDNNVVRTLADIADYILVRNA